MDISRRAVIGGAAPLLPPPLRARRASPGLAEIVERLVRARGGAAALDRVRSCRMELEIEERNQTIHGLDAADAAGLVRIDIHAGGNLAYSEGVDRRGGWFREGREAAPQPNNAPHPDVDLTKQRVETRFSDFGRVEGAVAAHRDIDVDLARGATLATHQVGRREINPRLPQGLFDRTYQPV